ncbi:FG-GAP-like repeat-containing protein [Roseivirga thermotolerans]|uniref:FG-GAP-like repeat-containing protein n=1 Tax=Roseivirga thermotolerans TaxID=1758176 RepID=UPI00273F158F|nr:FG-GAP-like repeat-containing protein [Roseivirga thermotolerans]
MRLHFLKCNAPILLLILLVSCGRQFEKEQSTLFELLPANETGINFNNVMQESKEINLMNFAPIYNGGGVAVGDFNNDGLEDLFFTGNMVSSKLYLNKGNFEFEDITEAAGLTTNVWCNGVSVVDINEDGFQDLYIAVSGPNKSKRKNLLYINQGDLTFVEKAEEYGLADDGYSTHSAFFDYDLDGDLDMYLLTYGNNEGTDLKLVNKKIVDGSSLSNDKLFRNDGNGRFTDVTLEAGILVEGYGLGLAINDFNNDLYPDIYVSNDFLFDDIVYINNGDGTFTDRAKDYLKHTSQFGMGVDVQDFNNDLLPDIVQVDMMPEDNYRQKKILGPMAFDFFNLSIKEGYTPQFMRNTLQLNKAETGFAEIGQFAGIHETDWSWAPVFADYDANGQKDLIITNGFRRNVTDFDFRNYVREQLELAKEKGNDPDEVALAIVQKTNDIKLPNYAYAYNGDLTFTKATDTWGLSAPTWSNGMIYADLDHDGDLDLAISNIDDVAHIYKNTLNDTPEKPNYVKVKLEGTEKNPEGIGAKIVIRQSNVQQSHYQSKTRGYLSTLSPIIHFGLGKNTAPVTIEVTWPNGLKESREVETNSTATFDITQAKAGDVPKAIQLTTGNQALEFGLGHIAKENDYVDFYYEPLLPHRLSQQGPAMAVGDVNGDGLDDLFIGGSSNLPNYLFIQNNGRFVTKELALGQPSEDTDALFFDADGDGDLDLYVCSGSNEFNKNSPVYQDRLYLNDGKGNFSLSDNLPSMLTSSSVVRAADFDNDGDLDLFVGGALSPREYPLPGTSYLLRNEKGRFFDVTDSLAPELRNIGMVRDAQWADIDGNGTHDLVLVGEFMPVTIFEQENGEFSNKTSTYGLEKSTGWWNTVWVDDVDGNGYPDILAGNLGLNTKYQVSPNEPLSVYAKDYDRNGMIDAIMSCYINGEQHLLHSKSTLEAQVVSFKKRFLKHEPFAQANFNEIVPENLRSDAYTRHVYTFKHTAFMGNGKGFRSVELPLATQIAPLQKIIKKDSRYYLSGNNYSTEVTVGQYDASRGFEIRYNDNLKQFELVSNSEYRALGDIKNAVLLEIGDRKVVVHGVNNDTLYVRELK